MSLEQLAIALSKQLLKRNLKLTTAESCTGGGLAYVLTEIPGSSQWFERGYVSYSNRAKYELLGVQLSTLESKGAVSKETAHEMAEGALQKSNVDISIAITGIAGPDGGSSTKPVGTVWFACAVKNAETRSRKEVFSGDRHAIREQSIRVALEELIYFLESCLE